MNTISIKYTKLGIRPSNNLLQHCPICGSLPVIFVNQEKDGIELTMTCPDCFASDFLTVNCTTTQSAISENKMELVSQWSNQTATFYN